MSNEIFESEIKLEGYHRDLKFLGKEHLMPVLNGNNKFYSSLIEREEKNFDAIEAFILNKNEHVIKIPKTSYVLGRNSIEFGPSVDMTVADKVLLKRRFNLNIFAGFKNKDQLAENLESLRIFTELLEIRTKRNPFQEQDTRVDPILKPGEMLIYTDDKRFGKTKAFDFGKIIQRVLDWFEEQKVFFTEQLQERADEIRDNLLEILEKATQSEVDIIAEATSIELELTKDKAQAIEDAANVAESKFEHLKTEVDSETSSAIDKVENSLQTTIDAIAEAGTIQIDLLNKETEDGLSGLHDLSQALQGVTRYVGTFRNNTERDSHVTQLKKGLMCLIGPISDPGNPDDGKYLEQIYDGTKWEDVAVDEHRLANHYATDSDIDTGTSESTIVNPKGLKHATDSLQSDIDNNTSNISTNASDIANESTRASNKENELSANITTNSTHISSVESKVDNVNSKVSDNANDISSEISRATSKEHAIDSAIAANKSRIATLTSNLASKVDKVTGKGLSSNDFTDELKQDILDAKEYLNTLKGSRIFKGTFDTLDDARSTLSSAVDGWFCYVGTGVVKYVYLYSDGVWNYAGEHSSATTLDWASSNEVIAGTEEHKIISPKSFQDSKATTDDINNSVANKWVDSSLVKSLLGVNSGFSIINSQAELEEWSKRVEVGANSLVNVKLGPPYFFIRGDIIYKKADGSLDKVISLQYDVSAHIMYINDSFIFGIASTKMIDGDIIILGYTDSTYKDGDILVKNGGTFKVVGNIKGSSVDTSNFLLKSDIATQEETFDLSSNEKVITPSSMGGIFKYNSHKIMANYTEPSPGDAYVGYRYASDQYYGEAATGNIIIGKAAVGGIEIGSVIGEQSKNKIIAGMKSITFEEIINLIARVEALESK